jgi:hypothetical protein
MAWEVRYQRALLLYVNCGSKTGPFRTGPGMERDQIRRCF